MLQRTILHVGENLIQQTPRSRQILCALQDIQISYLVQNQYMSTIDCNDYHYLHLYTNF